MFIVCILFIHSMLTVCTLYNKMYPILLLNFEKQGALMPLCVISYPGGEALKCNLTGRCPFFKSLHKPFRKKICILIPCFGIFRLQNNRTTIGKTITYCSWKTIAFCSWTNSHNLFWNFWSIFIPRSGIYAEKWYPEKRHVPYRFILKWPPGISYISKNLWVLFDTSHGDFCCLELHPFFWATRFFPTWKFYQICAIKIRLAVLCINGVFTLALHSRSWFFSIGIFESSHSSTATESLRARGSHQTRIYKHHKNNSLEIICCKSKQWYLAKV